MHRLLLLLVSSLLVSSLAAASMRSPSEQLSLAHQRFRKSHVYHGEQLVNCNQAMQSMLTSVALSCFTSTFILGDNGYPADQNAVEQVCGDGGTKVEGTRMGATDQYTSNKEFRVVTCKLISGRNPPGCNYRPVTDADIVTRQITVCSNNAGIYKGKTIYGKDPLEVYESRNNFRVVRCELTYSDRPPYCMYRKVEEQDVNSTQITVACKKNLPARLEPC